MRRLAAAVACAVSVAGSLALAGCASSGLGFQQDGRYLLDRSEQGMDCPELYRVIWGRTQVMKTLPDKAAKEKKQVSATASQWFGRWFGAPGKGIPSIEEYDRERVRVYALHRAMQEKKCMTLDLEKELTASDALMDVIRQQD